MNDLVEIFFDPAQSNIDRAQVTIDSLPVQSTQQYDCLQITTNLAVGMHVIRLATLEQHHKITITDVRINAVSIRNTIYLSWVEDQHGIRTQPATCVWQPSQTWILPVMNPVSAWLTEVNRHVTPEKLSDNLWQKYDFYFPESITVDPGCPQVVRDFFSHDLGFSAITKGSPRRKYPYRRVTHDKFDFSTLPLVRQEILNNLDYFYLHSQTSSHCRNEKFEDSNYVENHWKFMHLLRHNQSGWLIDTNLYPHLMHLIQALPGKIISGFVSITHPRSYITPHADNWFYNDPDYSPGCSALYISVDNQPGSMFRMAGVGAVPNDTAVLVNTTDYTHSVINTTDDYRIIVSVRIDVDKDHARFGIID